MQSLRNECLNQKHWVDTLDRLMEKPNVSRNEKDNLMLLNMIAPDLINQLFDGTYEWSIPTKTAISKSGTTKKRIVYIYSMQDRYLLGILYRAFSVYYSNKINPHCFSYKTGTSTNTAIKYIKQNIKQNKLSGVKLDIHAYFNSVSEQRVREIIDELFEEGSGIKKSMQDLFLDNRCYWKGSIIEEFKGLIPGTALASFFANYCLAPLDTLLDSQHIIFARYSDDIIIIDKNKEKLDEILETVKKCIGEYGLEINPDKYKWFEDDEDFEFLGLKISNNGTVDISDHAKKKMKKQIYKWCKKGRRDMEMKGYAFKPTVIKIMHKFNNKNFKCFINNESTFGWCHYAFRYLTTDKSLIEMDKYVRDTIKAMKIGKYKNIDKVQISEEEFTELGWVSLKDLYDLYKKDFDYYCEVIELL